MKKLLLVALAIGLFASEVSAQGYGWGPPPPPPPRPYYGGPGYGPPPGPPRDEWRHRRPRNWCEEKARRLHRFEYEMTTDGRVSRDEQRIANSLRADLANSCGGGRWAPERGWHYR